MKNYVIIDKEAGIYHRANCPWVTRDKTEKVKYTDVLFHRVRPSHYLPWMPCRRCIFTDSRPDDTPVQRHARMREMLTEQGVELNSPVATS